MKKNHTAEIERDGKKKTGGSERWACRTQKRVKNKVTENGNGMCARKERPQKTE